MPGEMKAWGVGAPSGGLGVGPEEGLIAGMAEEPSAR